MTELTVARTSIWADTAKLPLPPPLVQDVNTDVCIIGAGIAGLSTAYMLARAGKKVVVLDDGPIAGGQTEVTTAHLSSAIDDRDFEIERIHGREGARLAVQSHMAAIDRIEANVRYEQIDCDFVRLDGYLFAPPGDVSDVLDREFDAARRTGVSQVERVPRVPLDHFDTGPALRFARQGQFHPLQYLAGLSQAIARHGGTIHTRTHAERIEGGDLARIETADGPLVTAGAVVVATNTPINDMFAIHTKQAPYHTYVVGIRLPRGAVTRALYWDTMDPYHYVRLQTKRTGFGSDDANAHDVLIVGGEDHKAGHRDDGEERFARLEQWARERFPMLQEREYHWSGQVMETYDGLAFIGRNPGDAENVYVATGDSGMGMTHGTIAGMLLSDLILGRENPWARIYDPSRKMTHSLGAFAKENLDVAVQYGAWLTPGQISAPNELMPGTGAIMRRGLSKVAVYKDERGAIHKCSAACPHLQCIVAWNSADRTWDCPCHGSRFDPLGKVLNGPANVDLTPFEE